MKNETLKQWLAFGAAALVITCLYFSRITPDQITACQESTGWSESRCAHEIMR